jgi:hypothetical protein
MRIRERGGAVGFFDWFKKADARAERGAGEQEPEPKAPGPELPDCNVLFERFAFPWYTAEDLLRTARKPMVRPDIERIAAMGTPAAQVCLLTPESATKVAAFLRHLACAAAEGDENLVLGCIQGLDRIYDREKIAELLAGSDPANRSNYYAGACLGFGTVLGEVLIKLMPGCVWLPSSPIWECAVYDPRAGVRINGFDWAVKKMSEYGVDDGFAMKVKVCAALHQREWQGVGSGSRDLVPA